MANVSLETIVKVDGSIVSELSERIPSNIVALNELIKNSYDAGSPEVQIKINSEANLLIIKDEGEGMDKADIDTLFHISKSIKRYGQFNKKYNRYVQGSKGLGFLSVFKFGHKVEWRTKKDIGYKFSVDYNELSKIENLSDFKVKLTADENIVAGTEITIELSNESKQLLLNYLSEEKNYTKIINSFTDENFLVILDIDGKVFRSDDFKGVKNHYLDRQLYYVEYDSKEGKINYYHNNCFAYSKIFPCVFSEFSLKVQLSIYSFRSKQKANICKLFYDNNDKLTPLIYINNNFFNNFEIFDPSIMKTIKYEYDLHQMIGFVNIYSDNPQIQFNSDRTRFAQNLLTDEIIKFLKGLNHCIQEEGAKRKSHLIEFDFLTCEKIDKKDIDLNDLESLKKFIKDDFAFKEDVNITVEGNFINYSIFGKTAIIEIVNSQTKIFPARIQLAKLEDTIYLPSRQIDLCEYIIVANDSTGKNVKDKIKICIDGIESSNNIIETQENEKILKIEYSYNDINTKLIKQNLILIFKKKEVALIGTYNNESQLLYVKMKEGYKISFDNTISNLINQINSLQLEKYREVIACSLRVLFDLSIKCIRQSNKRFAYKNKLVYSDNVKDIETIIEYCNLNKKEIDDSTKISYYALKNILIVNDFVEAYNKSNLGPHSSNAYLSDNDIKHIAQKTAYFLVFVNEIILNNELK